MSETGAGDGARRRRRSLFEREQPADTRPDAEPSAPRDATAEPPVKVSAQTAALAHVEIQPVDAVPPVRRTPAPAPQRPVSEAMPLPLPAHPTLMPISSVIETPPAVRERAPGVEEPAYVAPAPLEPDPTPVEPTAVEAAPIAAEPAEAAPVEAAPVEAAPVEAAPIEAAPVEAPEPLAAPEPAPEPEQPAAVSESEPAPPMFETALPEVVTEPPPAPEATRVEALTFAPPVEGIPEPKAEPEAKDAGVVAPLRRANRTSTADGDRPAPMQTLAPQVLDQPKRDEMLNSTADVNVALFFNNTDNPTEPEEEDEGPRPGVTMFASFGIVLLAVLVIGLLIGIVLVIAAILAN